MSFPFIRAGGAGFSLFALYVSTAAAQTTAPITARFEPATCPVTVAADEKIDCGVLRVPENRSAAASRTIKLPVMIYRSRSATPAADPVLFIPGGPGGSALANRISSQNNPFLDDRDYILLEPRGSRFSDPDLECPAINALKGDISAGHLRGKPARDALAKAAGDCRAALTKAGVDLNFYTSAQTADDIEDLRKALGYASWNLFGHSYGTRLALTVLRDHPAGVRSVILDSVLPPDVNFDEHAGDNLLRALDVVFDGCAIDRECSAAYPHLRKDFASLIARADRKPLRLLAGAADDNGKPVEVRGTEIVDAIYSLLHSPGRIPLIPRIIGEAASGNYAELAPVIKNNQGPSSFIWGLRLSVWCGEEAPFEDAARSDQQISPSLGLAGIDERTAAPDMCRAWNVAPAAPLENEPVKSDVPVLVLSGEFDPDTPPDWGHQLLETMKNARFLSFPGRSHGAGFNHCGAQIEAAFLRDPHAPLATDCILQMRGADFGLSVLPAH